MTFQEIDEKFKDSWQNFWMVTAYETFQDIPVDFRVPEALFVWVHDSPEMFKEIPLEFLDHEIRLVAVYKSAEAIVHIKRSDTDRYEELLLFSIFSNPSSFGAINPKDYSDHLIIEAIKARPDVSHHLHHVINSGYKLSSDIVSAVFERDIVGIRALFGYEGLAGLVTDEMVWRGVSNSFVDYNGWYVDLRSLESLGKTHVVQDMISSGYWPPTFRLEFDEPYFPDVVRPTSLAEAIAGYLSDSNGNFPELFKFAVLSYGTDDVIAALHSSSDGLDTLQTLYTENELAPYAQKYKGLKGRLLEDALGM